MNNNDSVVIINVVIKMIITKMTIAAKLIMKILTLKCIMFGIDKHDKVWAFIAWKNKL